MGARDRIIALRRDYAARGVQVIAINLLGNRPVTVAPTNPVGCNVKWRGQDGHWLPKSLADYSVR